MASPGRHGDSCPICLQLYPPLDKAVISSCLHTFCITCLAAWCDRKRACPVCRGKVSSYYHTIHSDLDFLEHVFTPEPAALAAAVDAQQQQRQRLGLFDLDSLLDLQQEAERLSAAVDGFTAQLRSHRQQQQQQEETTVVEREGGSNSSSSRVEVLGRARAPRVQLVQERFTSWGDPEQWMRHVRQGHQQQQQQQQSEGRQRHHHHHQQQQQQYGSVGNTSNSSSSSRAAQPRPYFWRMQQHMMASLQHPPSTLNSSHSQADAAQSARLSRRAVYLSNRWAKPYEPPPHYALPANRAAAAGSSGGNGGRLLPRVSDASLQIWLERELQALLLDQDVTIVCAYVRGLINSFGLHQQQQQQGQVPTVPVGGSNTLAAHSGSTCRAMQQAAAAAAAAAGPQQLNIGSSQPGGAPAAAAAAAVFDAAAAAAAPQQPTGTGSTIPDAAAALESFLFDNAAHFWHELSCFALSGLTVAAWDRVVRYGAPPTTQQQHQQQHQHEAALQQQQAGPAGLVVCGGSSNGGARKQQHLVRTGWDVPPAAAAPAAAQVAPAAAAPAVTAAPLDGSGSVSQQQQQQQQQQGDQQYKEDRHDQRKHKHKNSCSCRHCRSGTSSRGRSCSREVRRRSRRRQDVSSSNYKSRGRSRSARRRQSSSSRSRSPVARVAAARVSRSRQYAGSPGRWSGDNSWTVSPERAWSAQQQQQQLDWCGRWDGSSIRSRPPARQQQQQSEGHRQQRWAQGQHRERGGNGWQQAVLLKQLGGVGSRAWQQQQLVDDNDRWDME